MLAIDMDSLCSAFPHQAFWHMVALSKSSKALRRRRCREVLTMAGEGVLDGKQARPEVKKFVSDATALAGKLQELAEQKLGHGSQVRTTSRYTQRCRLLIPGLPDGILKNSRTCLVLL